jgi:protein SCO1/2
MRRADRGPLAALCLILLGIPALGGGDPERAEPRWGAEYFPNVPLITHEGRSVRFFDDLIQDKVVVISFIYTSCPDACPLETAKLVEVQELLGERVGRDVFLYSISIDPERDTPEVLREYAQRFQTGPGWLFLTGAAEDIRLLRGKLGMIDPDGETSLQQHTLNLLIGSQKTGMWIKRSPFENPYLLATQIGTWLHDWRPPPPPGRDYADAPELRSLSRGENLFRTRCSVCHAIGGERGLARQGPDLLGVTERREHAWLARWLAEPDVMLAEGDPTAVALRAAFRDLPMPNMRLNALEVQALIEYMAEESMRILAEESAPPGPPAEPGAVPACCQKGEELVIGEPAGTAVPVPVGAIPAEPPVAPAARPASRAAPELPRSSLELLGGSALALALLALLVQRRPG